MRPVQRGQARVQLILQVALGSSAGFLLGFTWFYSLHQQLQRGKAIQQRPYNTVEAAAANQLTLPSFENTKSNLRKQGTKNS